jgi:predicted ATPase
MPGSGHARLSQRAGFPRSTLTELVGRQREIAAALRILGDGQRLLTLTGPGGVGKTQLSLAIASSAADLFPDGTVFVSLAPIVDPELVPGLVAPTSSRAWSATRRYSCSCVALELRVANSA